MSNVLVYIASEADKVLLDQFPDAEAGEIYGRAYQLIIWPTSNLETCTDEGLKRCYLKRHSLFLSPVMPRRILDEKTGRLREIILTPREKANCNAPEQSSIHRRTWSLAKKFLANRLICAFS
jgi:hypothetical protein